jgi:hypothetical protein
VPREPPSIEPLSKVPADQHEYQSTGDRADSNHQQDRARDRIVNERKRKWQARDDNANTNTPAIRSINTE